MEACCGQRQEKDGHYLRRDDALDFFLAHADFLHDEKALLILISFGNLFVLPHQYRSQQEEQPQKDTQEKQTAVKR